MLITKHLESKSVDIEIGKESDRNEKDHSLRILLVHLPYCSDPPSNFVDDGNTNTNCVNLPNSCDTYHDCRDVSSSCDCSAGLACGGSCPECWPSQEWSDIGGCGDRGCLWSQKPQSREFIPSRCSEENKCDPRPLSECPCVPDVICEDLGCEETDSCGTYCGDCPS